MAIESLIEWCMATWNPWHGCHKISPACQFCYMFRDKLRYGQDPNLVVRSKTTFNDPLKWNEPKLIFTCSWSDFFIEEADQWREAAWNIIKNTPHHTYQILTKRPERILSCLPEDWGEGYENVWLMVSVESQKYVWRIEELLNVPARVRGISAEPLLGHLDLMPFLTRKKPIQGKTGNWMYGGEITIHPIHWVIAGGESGSKARPSHPDWFRSLRVQCSLFDVPFFFKQWGEWLPIATPRLQAHHGIIEMNTPKGLKIVGDLRTLKIEESEFHKEKN